MKKQIFFIFLLFVLCPVHLFTKSTAQKKQSRSNQYNQSIHDVLANLKRRHARKHGSVNSRPEDDSIGYAPKTVRYKVIKNAGKIS